MIEKMEDILQEFGRRFAFGLGRPNLGCKMAICYRPSGGTLYTSIVIKIQEEEGEMIVVTSNSIYHFQEVS